MRQSIAALISLVQFVSLLLVLISPSFAASSDMMSNSGRIVKEGTTFNITCRFTETNYVGSIESKPNIKWGLPIIFNQKEMSINKTFTHHDRQMTAVGPPFDITITSTLTVYNATSKETGTYWCFWDNSFERKQEIYINDGKNLVSTGTFKRNLTFHQMEEASNVTFERIEVADEGSLVVIPCRATQPNVRVSFSHRTLASVNLIAIVNDSTNQNAQNLYRNIVPGHYWNSKYIISYGFPYHAGLIVKNVVPSDSGIYKCSGTNGTTTSEIHVLLIVKGIDVAMVGGYREVEEGSNVTLVCTIYNVTRLPSEPVWRYGKRFGKLEEITENYLTYGVFDAKISHDHFMNEFYRSTLQLFNVTRVDLMYNYFDCCPDSECEVNRIRDREIAIRFKSTEKDVEIVEIETGRLRTLTCANERNFAVINYPNIQWFKDDKLVNMIGKQNVDEPNELTLNGDPANDGTYKCKYVDKYEDERHRIFVVKTIRSKSKAKDLIETIFLEMDRNKTIECSATENATNFQWFKEMPNKEIKTVNMTGQENASQLTLNGDPDDVGTYQCRYDDKYGDERQKTFVVVPAPKESNNQTTPDMAIIITIGILAITVVSVVGLLWFFRNSRRKLFSDAEKLLKGTSHDFDILPEEDAQYAQQPYDKRWEFPRNRIKIGEQIGAGNFGRVLKCEAIGIKGANSETVTTVAVKMIKSRELEASRELKALIAELKILSYLGSHPNVVCLLGACTKTVGKGDLMVILEYCPFGNLNSFLNDPNNQFDDGYEIPINRWTGYLIPISANEKSLSPTVRDEGHMTPASATRHADKNESHRLYGDVDARVGTALLTPATEKRTYSTLDLISWSWQIAKGMGHLANKKVVHGDLAARNVLLADHGFVKVADFGLANRLYYKGYYQKGRDVPLPTNWMAPESLINRKFTSQSDVWSFGVVLWELFSLGKIPYPGVMTGRQLVNELESGHRMEKPTHAPGFIGELLNLCWQWDPTNRPTFKQLEGNLFRHLDSSVSSFYSEPESTAQVTETAP